MEKWLMPLLTTSHTFCTYLAGSVMVLAIHLLFLNGELKFGDSLFVNNFFNVVFAVPMLLFTFITSSLFMNKRQWQVCLCKRICIVQFLWAVLFACVFWTWLIERFMLEGVLVNAIIGGVVIPYFVLKKECA